MDSLHVCISCRYQAEQKFFNDKRGGQILFDTLASRVRDSGLNLQVRPTECLSACRNHCALAFTGSRKMTMVFGRLNVASGIEPITDSLMQYAAAYCDKTDGFILRADRPTLLQDKLLARVPPAETTP